MQHHLSLITRCLLLCVVALGLCSCAHYSRIAITNVGNVKVETAGGGKFNIAVDATMSNPTGSKVKLKSAEFRLYKKEVPFANINLLQPLTIAKHSDEVQTVNVELQLQNLLLALLSKGFAIDDFFIDGTMIAQTFPFRKKIGIPLQSLKSFEAQYGSFISQITNVQR
ncbi:hypothetical protein AGMMS4956_05370 [Bacteroidia bacterium]|nr:hypothetical protein AGMMS4956_05370 [Bacteroidia bacterium]